MKITHKATYFLLDKFYARRSLNEFINNDIGNDIFNASVIFAEEREDFDYLASMVNKRDELEKNFCLFVGQGIDLPIILTKNQDLTLLEFAVLYRQCNIHISEFKEVVNSTAEGLGLDTTEQIDLFDAAIKAFENETDDVPGE